MLRPKTSLHLTQICRILNRSSLTQRGTICLFNESFGGPQKEHVGEKKSKRDTGKH